MRHNTLDAAALATLLALAGCGGSSGSDVVASATIGPAGGTVQVPSGSPTLAGATVDIPSGALAQQEEITISDGSTTQTSGIDPIGPAALLGPEGLMFAVNAKVTLPFYASKVPGGTSQLMVEVRDQNGQLSQLPPSQVGTDTVTFETDHFSTFWVVTPFVITADYLPLENDSEYVFDNGVMGTVSLLSKEPNLQGVSPLFALNFMMGIFEEGTYLMRNSQGETLVLGNYSMADDYQEVLETDAVWLPQGSAIGGQNASSDSYKGYEPYGTSQVAYTGNQTLTTTFLSQGSLTTPLGTFSDVIEVRVVRVYMGAGSRGTSGMTTNKLWLARSVGPVQIELEGTSMGGLTGGHVGASVIVPQ